MKRTENFRRENRREYKSEYKNKYKNECKRANSENIYRELTREGQRFCAVAGLLEEIVVLAVFGIRISTSPFPVLAFLWVLFVILTAAALIGVACLLDRIAVLRPTPEGGRRCRNIRPTPVHCVADDGYGSGTERTEWIAA